MKTIGVIGGIGPQATMDFEARVHAISQQLIPRHKNSGYPPMVVYYFRDSPAIMGERGPVRPMQPNPILFQAVSRLGGLVDFFVIPSNAPHLFQEEIEQATGRKVLSIIDVTVNEVRKRGLKRVGIVGLGEPTVHKDRIDQLGISYVLLPAETGGIRDQLDDAIWRVMEGTAGPDEEAVAAQAIEMLRAQDTDGIVLGCTEIPLLLRNHLGEPDLINPAQLLAEAAVRYAMEPA